MKHFLYIAQASRGLLPARAPFAPALEEESIIIGITDNLDRRLKTYNSATGHSKENRWEYLFTYEVKNVEQVEKDIKIEFPNNREDDKQEVYTYTTGFF